jgi:hypothetical protein
MSTVTVHHTHYPLVNVTYAELSGDVSCLLFSNMYIYEVVTQYAYCFGNLGTILLF